MHVYRWVDDQLMGVYVCIVCMKCMHEVMLRRLEYLSLLTRNLGRRDERNNARRSRRIHQHCCTSSVALSQPDEVRFVILVSLCQSLAFP